MRTVRTAVDTGDVHQRMEGFGVCEVTWTPPACYLTGEFYDTLVYDLGLSIIRIPLAASMERSNDDARPDHFNWDAFRPDRMGPRMAYAQEFQRRGVSTFFGSLWSPPRWQKTNRGHFHGGHLRPDMRDEFAEYIAASVLTMKREWDIELHGVSLQNELYFIEPYHSCLYNPHQIREAVRAVARKFRTEGITTRIAMPESMGFRPRFLWYVRPLLDDPETRKSVGLFCTHSGRGGIEDWRDMRREIADTGKQLWLTETGGGRRDWKGCMALATGMHDALVGGSVSAWIFWQPIPLLGGNTKTLSYRVARHFFRFIRPGMHRVAATCSAPGVLVSAYRDAESGATTCVAINTTEEPVRCELDLPEGPEAYGVHMSTDDLACADCGELSTLEMPPRSIVSLAAGAAPPEKPRDFGEPLMTSHCRPKNGRLANAVNAGDVEAVKRLIAEGSDVNAPSILQDRPLHVAAYGRDPDVIPVLVKAGADLEARDDKNMTPLMLAARRAQPEQVKALLDCGADARARDDEEWTALHYAAQAGIAEMVEDLLTAGADPLATTADGITVLHMAAGSHYEGSIPIIKNLLEMGANPNACTADGWTSLHSVAANCHTAHRTPPDVPLRKTTALLEAGADPHARDVRGRTPLHWAALMGHWRCDEEHLTTRVYDLVVRRLLEAGADADAQDDDGWTTLHCAASEGFDAICEALVAGGADTSKADNEGRTPADLARAAFFPDIAKIIETGQTSTGGSTTAEESASSSDTAKGTRQINQALRDAAQAGDSADVEQLLADGADPNWRAHGGGTALHHAAARGDMALVRTLLDAGADRAVTNSDGFTPADMARQNGHDAIVQLLLNP